MRRKEGGKEVTVLVICTDDSTTTGNRQALSTGGCGGAHQHCRIYELIMK